MSESSPNPWAGVLKSSKGSPATPSTAKDVSSRNDESPSSASKAPAFAHVKLRSTGSPAAATSPLVAEKVASTPVATATEKDTPKQPAFAQVKLRSVGSPASSEKSSVSAEKSPATPSEVKLKPVNTTTTASVSAEKSPATPSEVKLKPVNTTNTPVSKDQGDSVSKPSSITGTNKLASFLGGSSSSNNATSPATVEINSSSAVKGSVSKSVGVSGVAVRKEETPVSPAASTNRMAAFLSSTSPSTTSGTPLAQAKTEPLQPAKTITLTPTLKEASSPLLNPSPNQGSAKLASSPILKPVVKEEKAVLTNEQAKTTSPVIKPASPALKPVTLSTPSSSKPTTSTSPPSSSSSPFAIKLKSVASKPADFLGGATPAPESVASNISPVVAGVVLKKSMDSPVDKATPELPSPSETKASPLAVVSKLTVSENELPKASPVSPNSALTKFLAPMSEVPKQNSDAETSSIASKETPLKPIVATTSANTQQTKEDTPTKQKVVTPAQTASASKLSSFLSSVPPPSPPSSLKESSFPPISPSPLPAAKIAPVVNEDMASSSPVIVVGKEPVPTTSQTNKGARAIPLETKKEVSAIPLETNKGTPVVPLEKSVESEKPIQKEEAMSKPLESPSKLASFLSPSSPIVQSPKAEPIREDVIPPVTKQPEIEQEVANTIGVDEEVDKEPSSATGGEDEVFKTPVAEEKGLESVEEQPSASEGAKEAPVTVVTNEKAVDAVAKEETPEMAMIDERSLETVNDVGSSASLGVNGETSETPAAEEKSLVASIGEEPSEIESGQEEPSSPDNREDVIFDKEEEARELNVASDQQDVVVEEEGISQTDTYVGDEAPTTEEDSMQADDDEEYEEDDSSLRNILSSRRGKPSLRSRVAHALAKRKESPSSSVSTILNSIPEIQEEDDLVVAQPGFEPPIVPNESESGGMKMDILPASAGEEVSKDDHQPEMPQGLDDENTFEASTMSEKVSGNEDSDIGDDAVETIPDDKVAQTTTNDIGEQDDSEGNATGEVENLKGEQVSLDEISSSAMSASEATQIERQEGEEELGEEGSDNEEEQNERQEGEEEEREDEPSIHTEAIVHREEEFVHEDDPTHVECLLPDQVRSMREEEFIEETVGASEKESPPVHDINEHQMEEDGNGSMQDPQTGEAPMMQEEEGELHDDENSPRKPSDEQLACGQDPEVEYADDNHIVDPHEEQEGDDTVELMEAAEEETLESLLERAIEERNFYAAALEEERQNVSQAVELINTLEGEQNALQERVAELEALLAEASTNAASVAVAGECEKCKETAKLTQNGSALTKAALILILAVIVQILLLVFGL